LVRDISASNLQANISVKPSALGLLVQAEIFRRNLEQLLNDVSNIPMIELVMDSERSRDTLNAYDEAVKLLESGHEFRITISCRFYSEMEPRLQGVLDSGARIRIVKGAYDGEAELPTAELLQSILILQSRTEDPILATNNVRLVRLLEERRVIHYFCGFETLLGKHVDLERYLRKRGLRTLRYVPYGHRWIDYCARREKWFANNINKLKSILAEHRTE